MRITVYLEPVYTKNIYDEIIKNGAICYHITDINNEISICKNGLRPKVGKTPKQADETNQETLDSNKKSKTW